MTKRPVLDKNIINEQISADGTVSWQLKETVDSTRFIIQEWRWGTWYFKGEVKSYVDSANYSFKIDTIWAGYYGVRIVTVKNDSLFSKLIKYPIFTEAKIDPICGGNVFLFQQNTVYRIRKYKTNEVLLQGYGMKMNHGSIPSGVYHLDYANTTTEFIKKK